MPTTYIIYSGYRGLKYVIREIHGDKHPITSE